MAYRLFTVSSSFMKSSFVRDPHLMKKYCRHCSNASIRQESFNLGNVIKDKLNQLVQWYEETTGMDEVRIAQKRVLDAEEKFISAQDRRRDTNKDVNIIQNKLKELYAELDSTSRGEDRYVTLITEEHKLLKQERQVMDEFKRFEREEREHFSALSSAVKESHEKERAQAERTKYWSIIGSILGTIIGIIGSSVNNELKMKELRKLLKESTSLSSSTNNSEIPEILMKHDQKLNTLTKEIHASSNQNYEVVFRLNNIISALESNPKLDIKNVLHELSEQQLILEKYMQEMNKLILSQVSRETNSETYTLQTSDDSADTHDTTKLLFLSSVILIFPVVFSYFGLFS